MQKIKTLLASVFGLLMLIYLTPIIVFVVVAEAYAAHKTTKQQGE